MPTLIGSFEADWAEAIEMPATRRTVVAPVFNHIPINLTSEGARGHHRIIAALGAGDAKAARAAITEDLMKGGDRIIAALIQDKQPAH
jgi:DNA-binding GntR family transcriptional regulator